MVDTCCPLSVALKLQSVSDSNCYQLSFGSGLPQFTPEFWPSPQLDFLPQKPPLEGGASGFVALIVTFEVFA